MRTTLPEIIRLVGSLFLLGVVATVAKAQSDQDPVWSSNATITYGSSFTPSYNGGDGSGAFQFAVSGYTTDNHGFSSDGGTYYSSAWHSSWTPSAAGSYSFSIVRDGDFDYNPSSEATGYTLTVNKANQAGISSSNATISYGSSFTPSYSGGSGTGGWQFYVSSNTTWDTGSSSNTGTYYSSAWHSSWTPPAPGTYTFYVVRDADGNYNSSGSSSSYTLTVTKLNQASISSSNATISFNGSTQSYPAFTPSYSGGSGSGGWQFCIAGYTGWDTGTSSNTGTSSGSGGTGTWSSSWTPSAPGTYSFWVARDGDTYYNSSGAAGTYTLTVNGPVDGVQWNSIGLPSSAYVSSTISFTANVTNNGTSYWGSSYYLEAQNSSGTDLDDTSINGIYPSSSTTPTFTLTLPSSPGSYTYTFKALNSGVGYFGTPQTQSITVNALPGVPVITSAGSASGTFNSSFSYSITATNTPTSYGASGLPPGLSVNTSTGVISGTPTSAGSWSSTVSATNLGGTGSATLSITINPESTTFSASPTSYSYDGSSHGPTVTASPSGATYSTSGVSSASAEGSYSMTVTAYGNYSGSTSFSWSITPGQPGGVAAASKAPTVVKLAWTAPASGVGGLYYKVYTGSGSYVGTTSATSYMLTGFSSGASFSYYVVAFDSSGLASANSATVSGTTASGALSSSDVNTLLSLTSPGSTTASALQFVVLRPSQ